MDSNSYIGGDELLYTAGTTTAKVASNHHVRIVADPIQRMASSLRLQKMQQHHHHLTTEKSIDTAKATTFSSNVIDTKDRPTTLETNSNSINHNNSPVAVPTTTTTTTTTATTTRIKTGRGSVAGWTTCPLCCVNRPNQKKKSIKRYALGRGIASHLHAIHTPWIVTAISNKEKGKEKKKKKNKKDRKADPPKRTTDDKDDVESSISSSLHRPKRQKLEVMDDSNNLNLIWNIDENKDHDQVKLISKEQLQLQQGVATTTGAPPYKWIPTKSEIDTWNAKVLQIVTNLELAACIQQQQQEEHDATPENRFTPNMQGNKVTITIIPPGHDRTGENIEQIDETKTSGESVSLPRNGSSNGGTNAGSYRASIPCFLQAAANGDLQLLQDMIRDHTKPYWSKKDNVKTHCKSNCNSDMDVAPNVTGPHSWWEELEDDSNQIEIVVSTLELLDLRDRHGSIAEHWAAGGGHISSLQFLIGLRKQCNTILNHHAPTSKEGIETNNDKCRSQRRRDGKTCLHYAARNGQIECIRYIFEEKMYHVDVPSNDGTTPLHLACYGGHIDTIWYLIEEHQANIYHANDYGCSIAHWIGLSSLSSSSTNKICDSVPSSNDNKDPVVQLLSKLLHKYGVSIFLTKQNHGHTILHKAAQKLNQSIIEFFIRMANLTEDGMTLEQQQQLLAADMNQHTVSVIWRSFGGKEEFARRIEQWEQETRYT